MKIKKIYIKNFRSIKELSLTFPEKGLLVLVGSNNAGKSNILRAIDALLGDSWFTTDKLEIYDHYCRNRNNDIEIRVEFDTGYQVCFDMNNLFLKAVKAISLMTSNTVFYSQLEGDIRAIYGQGLLEPLPLQIELQQVQERLKRLREAEERELEADSRERIKRAVTAHENRIAELEALIAKGAESKASKQGEARL